MSESHTTGESGVPPAPGWWLASDGNWYPPQAQVVPQPPQQQHMPVYVTNASNGVATAAMAVGISGVCLFFVPFLGVIVGIVAVVLGFIGLANAKKGQGYRSRAMTGIITGIASVLCSFLFVGAVVQSRENNRPDICEFFDNSAGKEFHPECK
jgi:hypothetical protein